MLGLVDAGLPQAWKLGWGGGVVMGVILMVPSMLRA